MPNIYSASFTNIATGTALKTILQIATTATKPVEVIEWSLSFDGTNATAVPVTVQLQRQTTAGTITNTVTPTPWDSRDPAALTTAKSSASAEPTAGVILYNGKFTPVGLGPFIQYPPGRGVIVPVSGFLGIVATAAVTVNVWGHISWQE